MQSNNSDQFKQSTKRNEKLKKENLKTEKIDRRIFKESKLETNEKWLMIPNYPILIYTFRFDEISVGKQVNKKSIKTSFENFGKVKKPKRRNHLAKH